MAIQFFQVVHNTPAGNKFSTPLLKEHALRMAERLKMSGYSPRIVEMSSRRQVYGEKVVPVVSIKKAA